MDLGRGESLKDGLKSLAEENKSGYRQDWLWAWYNLSHPTLLERLKAIDQKTLADKEAGVEMKKKQ